VNIVRAARPDELPLLPEIEASADILFEEAGIKGLPPAGKVEDFKEADHIFVIGEPVNGFSRLDDIDGHAHLEQLSVDREHSGQGLGSELLEETCRQAQELGYSAITLITFKNLKWNAPFYAKHGFTEVSEVPEYLQPLRHHEQQLGLDDIGERVVMERKLA